MQKILTTNSVIKSVQWPVKNVQAFTTTRHHPLQDIKTSINSHYGNFNLATHVEDNPLSVEQNRHVLAQFLPENCQIQWLNQVHGAEVVEVEKINPQPIVADAAITHQSGIALAIMTADCLPILIAAKTGEVIAAIHGGWRPLANNIIGNTLAKMGVAGEQLVAWLGPCIGPNHFEVGSEVKQQFIALSPDFAPAFIATTAHKYLANLQLIASIQLRQHNVAHISTLADCTYANHDYYSYRREAKTGRMVTIICRHTN